MKRSEIKAGEIYAYKGGTHNRAAPVRVVSAKPHKVVRRPTIKIVEVEDGTAGVLVEKVSPEEIPGDFSWTGVTWWPRLQGEGPQYIATLRQIIQPWDEYAEQQRKSQEARARYEEEQARLKAEHEADTERLESRLLAARVQGVRVPPYGQSETAYSDEVVISRATLLSLLDRLQ